LLCLPTWFGSTAPGILVPSAEQKQSGRVHWFGSQSGALLGSVSTAMGGKEIIKKCHPSVRPFIPSHPIPARPVPSIVTRTPWTGDQPITRPLPACRTTQQQNKRTQTSVPQVGFEPTIPVFERAKTFYALDRAVTIGGGDFTFSNSALGLHTSLKTQFRSQNKHLSNDRCKINEKCVLKSGNMFSEYQINFFFRDVNAINSRRSCNTASVNCNYVLGLHSFLRCPR
jgi:hypothetical protein